LPLRWGWSLGDLIVRGAAIITWAPPLQTLTLTTNNKALKTRGGALPPTRAEIHRASMVQRPQRRGDQLWRRREAGRPRSNRLSPFFCHGRNISRWLVVNL
jgi:hypothetical protein